MATIIKQPTTFGYTKTIMTPKATITAYVEKSNTVTPSVYIEKRSENNGEVKTENLMLRLLTNGVRITEDNLDNILLMC